MKKATTILRLIDNLERELYCNYTHEQIQIAIQEESKKGEFLGVCDGLINVIDTATKEEDNQN